MSEAIFWPVPRVEIPTKRGLVVVGLDRYAFPRLLPGSAKAGLTPVVLTNPAREIPLHWGLAYLRALAATTPGARLCERPSEASERAPLFRRRGELLVGLDADGEVVVTGVLSENGRKWLPEAVESLRAEQRRRGRWPSRWAAERAT